MRIKDQGNYYKITDFPYKRFYRDTRRKYKTTKVSNLVQEIKSALYFFGKDVLIHKFFIPELLFVLQSINGSTNKYQELIDLIKTDTWYSESLRYIEGKRTIPTQTDFSLIKKEMDVELKPYQRDFIQIYNRKVIYDLRGYLLAFEQGLGKTLTALALMTSLDKKQVIIICPKSVMISVWKYHIERFFKNQKRIWFPWDKPSKDYDFYVANYESMSKLPLSFITRNSGIIVDESHNFLHSSSLRTTNLISIVKQLDCNDVLLMSGTPLKAITVEMIPILKILDKKFDDDCVSIFKRSLTFVTTNGTQILANRLGILMYRKLKTEVLTLPKKNEIIRKIKLPNGKDYTWSTIKTLGIEFISERWKYYKKNMLKYEKDFQECIDYLESILKGDKDWELYKKYIDILKKSTANNRSEFYYQIVSWTVQYEKNVLYHKLTPELKKKFVECKSVIKYCWLKIMGEFIGGFLLKLRNNMCKDIIEHSNLIDIVKNSEKKTLIFTSYVECVEYARDYFKKNRMKPLCIYGKTTGDLKSIISEFKQDDEKNPLIATIQTLSTGVTLTEANTIVFLNKPWRYIDYQQASDRVHRIGQDTEVFIYTLLLDTGNEKNLSTSMEEIMDWSKEMFENMMGDK